ncbi:murein hydrolase activator EnvC family protein [Parablastomonas sp. CN1-191]|uniref:murein hydrolase activator EnvC family protein n=1 Tax=Parablastomonas sp. CN1-191 TaxID=3400908 RepID=UPI003BF88E1C
MPRPSLPLLAAVVLLAAGAVGAQVAGQNTDLPTPDALRNVEAEAARARRRAEGLEREAERATAAADRTLAESAALAARIQQDQAQIAAHDAQGRLIAARRAQLRAQLAAKQAPLVRLTAALQRLSRRPVLLSLLRPGSLQETVRLRAVLASALPEVERRTAALRGDIALARRLEGEAAATSAGLRADRAELAQRQAALAALATRQRLAARDAGSSAAVEGEQALALAERARDLSALVTTLGQSAQLRAELGALPGPVLRPGLPGSTAVVAAPPPPPGPPARFLLPLDGRIVTGFGDAGPDGVRTEGILLAPRGGAQAVAPAAGRVAFAGPYRGFGKVVIVEHPGGWISVVTGLADLDARVGDPVVAGSPLGRAAAQAPVIGIELRKDGVAVNPLAAMRPG